MKNMDVQVCEQLVLRLFTPFEKMPSDILSPKSQEYQDWHTKMEESFYCHGPTLLLFTMIFTNKAMVRKKMSHHFYRSEILQTALEKVIVANVYLIDKSRLLNPKNFYSVLYVMILLRQFFSFYKKMNPKYEFDPYLDVKKRKKKKKNKECPSQSDRRVRLRKKPIELSNPRARANLLDFIQGWINPVLDMLREEIDRRHALNQSVEELEEVDRQLEIHIAQSLVGLINLGPIGDPQLERKLLAMLEKDLVHSNLVLREVAQNGMNTIFKNNGHLFNHFIEQSCRLHSCTN
ncbi:hypothetical protein RFI_17085 [Reticulomyxa filosa]|uniref:Uncharacterized protein n=1 Tax=Reticulomyxa filosa TaxID=46433 RepID=X6N491_RETFI|nr:hypothetical protein RFI_17085 [Reticulomyxa filosa]|eukprot:ETO20132.1 hypothetical protein RFI_17085 [Reticulomyxa filosa]